MFGPDSVVNSVPQDQSVARNIYLGHTQLIGGNKVNEFRATYMRANQLMTEADRWDEARDLYERAVALDSDYTPAWARLGRARRLIAK